MSIYKILFYIEIVSVFLTLAMGLIMYNRIYTYMKIIVLNILITCAVYVYGYFVLNNTWIVNVYMLLNFLCWVTVYFTVTKKRRQILLASVISNIILWLVCIVKDGINSFANWPMVYGSIITLILYFSMLLSIFREYNGNVRTFPLLWICVATLLYYGCTVPLFILINYLIRQRPELSVQMFQINQVLSILHSFMLVYSFYLARKPHNIQFLKQPYVRH
jgi:hypothetical protein